MVVRQRLLRLSNRGFVVAQRVEALLNRQRALEDGMNRAGVIAVGGCQVGLQLGLQIGGVELRQQLAGTYDVTLLDVNGIGRLRERALDRDVLIGRDDSGKLPRGFDRTKGRYSRIDVRGRRFVRGGPAPAAGYREDDEKYCENPIREASPALRHWSDCSQSPGS